MIKKWLNLPRSTTLAAIYYPSVLTLLFFSHFQLIIEGQSGLQDPILCELIANLSERNLLKLIPTTCKQPDPPSKNFPQPETPLKHSKPHSRTIWTPLLYSPSLKISYYLKQDIWFGPESKVASQQVSCASCWKHRLIAFQLSWTCADGRSKLIQSALSVCGQNQPRHVSWMVVPQLWTKGDTPGGMTQFCQQS